MLGLNVNASAATWKLNANGTYSCYENGKLVRNKWITQGGNRYYVNSSGIRQTGWLFSGGKWYFFIKSNGALLKNSWLTSEKKIYCAGSDGAMYAGGMRRINNIRKLLLRVQCTWNPADRYAQLRRQDVFL